MGSSQSRIRVEETEVESSNNRSGGRKWKQSTITIEGVRRSDDGLYECQAENEGGRFYKSGHIQVELAPICLKTPHMFTTYLLKRLKNAHI